MARARSGKSGVAPPAPLFKLLPPTQPVRPVVASDGEDTAAIGDRRGKGPSIIHVRKGVPLVCPCQEVVYKDSTLT